MTGSETYLRRLLYGKQDLLRGSRLPTRRNALTGRTWKSYRVLQDAAV